MKKLTWHNEKRKPIDLIPWEKNPRILTEKVRHELQESLERFNVVEPPAINLDNRVVGGHQRLKLLILLGRGEEPTDVRVPNRTLTEAEFEELAIRLNKNVAEWNFKLLGEFDEKLLADIGFENKDLGKIFDGAVVEDEFNSQEEYNRIRQPKARLGDLYQLGLHRLLCGDCQDPVAVDVLMSGEKAQMVFTDPPYNVDYKSPGGLSYNSTKFGGSGGKIFNDKKSAEDCLSFYSAVLRNLFNHPTQKPTRLAERALKKNSERNDIVADFFGGSGSTMIACQQLGRRCFSMELDPKYTDCMIKRWERFTKQKAVLLNNISNIKRGKKI